jgi:hypothetical protein
MILVRLVCQATFGKSGDVVAGFRQSGETVRTIVGQNVRGRILSDLSGPFDTVVQELEVESLAEWERLRAAIFSNPQVQEVEASLPAIIESGATEFYTVEATWP